VLKCKLIDDKAVIQNRDDRFQFDRRRMIEGVLFFRFFNKFQ